MVCPYCNTRSAPNQPVCSNCGVILRDLKTTLRKSKPFPWRRVILQVVSTVLAAIIAGIVGWFLGKSLSDGKHKAEVICTSIGAILGALIVIFVDKGSYFYQSWVLNNQRRNLQNQIQRIENDREKRNEARQKEADKNSGHSGAIQDRLNDAALYMVQGQIEEAMLQLEQIHRSGVVTKEDYANNLGVGFARRGQFQLAMDQFRKAIAKYPSASLPKRNLVLTLLRIGDDVRTSRELQDPTSTLRSVISEWSGGTVLGLLLSLCGEQSKADTILTGALRAQEKNRLADTHNDMGILRAATNDFKRAQDEFRLALRLEPGHAAAIANAGMVFHKQKLHSTAIERLEAAVIADPHNGMLHNMQGVVLCGGRLYNDAIRAFREARTHDLSLYEPNYNLAKLYIENDLADVADNYLARAAAINPYNWQTVVAQAVKLFKMQQIDQAMEMYLRAKEVRPNESSINGGLALCYTLIGNYFQGEILFEQAVEANPDDVDILANFSWHYLLRSDVQSASRYLERAIQLNKRHAVTNANLGLCQMDMGAPDTAEGYFKNALLYDPTLGTIHYNMGNNAIAQKNVDQAITAWEKGKKTENGNADLHTNLGVAYYREGKYDKAAIDFRRVLMLRQQRVEDYANLGITLSRLKRHKEAIEQFELGIKLDPRNAMLHSNLGLACYFANRVEEAMREWAEVTRVNAQYAQKRGTKQQTEFDDTSIDYVPIYISERALYTQPRVPDYLVSFAPGYSTIKYKIATEDEEIKKLEYLRGESAKVARALRCVRL